MNINEPTISRMLAILIQPVEAKERRRFIRDAESSPDLETFIRSLNEYEVSFAEPTAEEQKKKECEAKKEKKQQRSPEQRQSTQQAQQVAQQQGQTFDQMPQQQVQDMGKQGGQTERKKQNKEC